MTGPDDVPAVDRPVLLGRRHVLIGGAMLAASGLAVARTPKAYAAPIAKKRFQSWVPDTVGRWNFVRASGVVLPPPDALVDRLYNNLVTRVYEAPDSPPMMLLIAYSNTQDGMLQIHRPEVCYPVGGYLLSPTASSSLHLGGRAVQANKFSAVGPDRTEQVLYWTRIGDAFPRSWTEQRLAVAKANIAGRIPDGAMMRVSLIGNDLDAAEPVLEGFARDFVAASPPMLGRILLGPTG